MENTQDKPLYSHDCKECTYLGWDINESDNSKVDMYFCPQNGLPTIIMRYGDDGAEYISAPISVINSTNTYDSSPLLRNMLISEDMGLWARKRETI